MELCRTTRDQNAARAGGEKIGVLSLGASNHMAVVTALRHWGIEEKSVTIMRAGGISERLAALQSRLIDATVLIPPETRRARKLGIPILLELTDLFSYAMIKRQFRAWTAEVAVHELSMHTHERESMTLILNNDDVQSVLTMRI